MNGTVIVRVLLGDMSSAVRRTIKDALNGARDLVIVGEISAKDDVVATILGFFAASRRRASLHACSTRYSGVRRAEHGAAGSGRGTGVIALLLT